MFDQTKPPVPMVRISVTATQAAERMREAKWREPVIALLLKLKWIKSEIPIGNVRMTILDDVR